jgi:hypothetical protein
MVRYPNCIIRRFRNSSKINLTAAVKDPRGSFLGPLRPFFYTPKNPK